MLFETATAINTDTHNPQYNSNICNRYFVRTWTKIKKYWQWWLFVSVVRQIRYMQCARTCLCGRNNYLFYRCEYRINKFSYNVCGIWLLHHKQFMNKWTMEIVQCIHISPHRTADEYRLYRNSEYSDDQPKKKTNHHYHYSAQLSTQTIPKCGTIKLWTLIL